MLLCSFLTNQSIFYPIRKNNKIDFFDFIIFNKTIDSKPIKLKPCKIK